MKYTVDGIEIEVYNLNQWWVASNVIGITLNGKIYLRYGTLLTDELLRHEYTHVLQQKELGYLLFLIKYGWWGLFKGYIKIPFEKEANANESVVGYLNNRPKNNWKNYK